MNHAVQWLTAAPLWDAAAKDPARLRAPALLGFATDTFMEDLAALLKKDRIDLSGVMAKKESQREPPIGAPPGWKPPTDGMPLKLYQPVHGRFYLVAASLVCQQVGLPDRAVSPGRLEKVGFVLRRRDAGGVESAWVTAGGSPQGWQALGKTQASLPADGEEVLPLYPMNFTLSGRKRRLFVGLVPTSSRDTFYAAPDRDPSDATDDPRQEEFEQRVRDPLKALKDQAPNSAPPPDASQFLLLDFADFLHNRLPVLWGLLGTPGGSAPAGQEAALFNLLDGTSADGTSSWRFALNDTWSQRDVISAEDGTVKGPTYDLTKGNLSALGLDAPDDTGALIAAVKKAIAVEPLPAAAPPLPEPVPKLPNDPGARFVLRCVYQRPRCLSLQPPLLSDPTDEFAIAGYFDADAPSRPVRIVLPPDAGIAALRKFHRNVGFITSQRLRNQLKRVPGVKDAINGKLNAGGSFNLGEICTFSLPIITLCAMIVLILFVVLLNIAFWWMPFFRICFPIPKKGPQGAVEGNVMDAGQLYGRGISFPPRVGPDGRVAWSQGPDNIREAIKVILLTEPRERLNLPDFGGGLGRLLFEPNTVATRARLARRISESLGRWEPRVTVESVTVEADPADARAAVATVTYLLVSTQARERVSLNVTLAGKGPLMPLQIATLDNRRYQDLLDEALARVPVHNPEWTNFNKSDPGVTLLELFAFFTETLLYRSNQIPERNRRKFLQLLGVPLQPATPARGLVALSNDNADLRTFTLNDGLEVRAGSVPFRTDAGLDVLPLEARAFCKRDRSDASDDVKSYYAQLYASFNDGTAPPPDFTLYQTTPFPPADGSAVDLGSPAVLDNSLWIALLARAPDLRDAKTAQQREDAKDRVRREIAGKTLSLGIVPRVDGAARELPPGGDPGGSAAALLRYQVPQMPPDRRLPPTPGDRVPAYLTLEAHYTKDVLAEPGVVEIALPSDGLALWTNLEPLEAGAGDFPPAIEDTDLADRVLTWLRVSPRQDSAGANAKASIALLWAGINAATVTQRVSVVNEALPDGTGEPDQSARLANAPVLPQSVVLRVTANNTTERWQEIDDLSAAGPEVPVPDPRLPPGAASRPSSLVRVFAVDDEAGVLSFGDGTHGARPPFGSRLRVDYDYAVGSGGNVGAAAINTGPALPSGVKVTNPVRTWGGADAEAVAEGEKQIARYLQHRDRLVTRDDFETITLRTPGVGVGRVEVLPCYNPGLAPSAAGDAAGAVTLMVIPSYDAARPEAPVPDRLFLSTICDYLEPRRLVTTEVFLRGPDYVAIWVAVGIAVVPGVAEATVREAVRQAVSDFLSPLPASRVEVLDSQAALLTAPGQAGARRGWPLLKPVLDAELMAVASRVSGVQYVTGVLIATEALAAAPSVPMSGLQLPWLRALTVGVGDPSNPAELRGRGTTAAAPPHVFPIPIVPEEC